MPIFHFWGKWLWLRKAGNLLVSSLSAIVFLSLDFLDLLLCVLYRYVDEFFEGQTSPPCYCEPREEERENAAENELSETLFCRKNAFREMGFVVGKWNKLDSNNICVAGNGISSGNRWSDCGCDSCVSWMNNGDQRLHVVLNEAFRANIGDCKAKPAENVVFLHGFLSSASFWTETVFPNLSESVKGDYRLFAVDLLGFGRSPKPRSCLYTLRDHLEMIEKSVICLFQLKSFHLVAHSMGCVIALALAAKYPNSVKSITLIAPPYFISSKDDACLNALRRLAGRSIWPPLLFGSAIMSWYEHIGRCVCFLFCRNHRTWEKILKLITHRRDLHLLLFHLTCHTHHSAWHTMHNVLCGGASLMNDYLESLINSGVKICVFQGGRDQVLPLECSDNIKKKVPEAEVNIIPDADHTSVILGREKDFSRDLEHIWASAASNSRK